MNQPTEEQLREFWERYGLVHITNAEPLGASNSCEAMIVDRPVGGWYKPNYRGYE